MSSPNFRRVAPAVLLAFLALLLAVFPVLAATTTYVIPPDGQVYGKTYQDWSVLWWQWVYSIPAAGIPPATGHPLLADSRTPEEGAPPGSVYDPDGVLCGQDQSGPVWFLGGTFAVTTTGGKFYGSAVRNCNITAGKAIFFPILNVEWDNFFPPYDYNSGELRHIVVKQMNGVESLAAELDGVALSDVTIGSDYKVMSPVFTITLAPGNIYGIPVADGTTVSSKAVSNGYWVMLAPLSEGSHTLHFAGHVVATNPDGSQTDFSLDITYNLSIG